MAELGTIQYTDVNAGTSPVDRRAELAALENTLNVGKTVVDEAIKGKVTGDMEEAISNAEIEAEPRQVPELESPGVISYPEGSREAHLSTTLDRLNRVIEQGNSNQRKLAEMRVKKVLAEAQDQFPWMFDDLQRRAGAVLSGSAELEQLALTDAAARQAGSDAQAQISAIVDHAQRKWADGGLGIDPSIQITDPRFVSEYSDRQALRDTAERASRITGMMVANDAIDASLIADEYTQTISGRHSLARAKTMEIFEDHGINVMLREIQKGEAGNLELIRGVQNVGIPNAIAELEIAKLELQQLWGDLISPRMANTPFFEDLEKRQNDAVSQLDSMISRLTAISDEVPSVPTLIEEMMAIRAYDFGRQMPEQHRGLMAWAGTRAGQTVINAASQAKTARGITLNDHLAGMAVSALGQMHPTLYGNTTPENSRALAFVTSGSYQITGADTPSDINKKIDTRFRDSSDPWMVPTRSSAMELDASTKSLINWDNIYSAADIPKEASAEFAGEYLTGMNTSFRAYNNIPDKPEDVQEIVLQSLASDNVTTAIELAGDGVTRNQRLAFGESAKEWYIDTDPLGRRQEASRVYRNTELNGRALYDIVSVDIDRMSSDGDFVYTINEDLVREIAAERLAVSRRLAGKPNVEKVRREIMGYMDPIAAEVMQQIKIEQNLMRANAASVDKRTRSEVNLEFYLGSNDPGNPLPWANIFRHETAQ